MHLIACDALMGLPRLPIEGLRPDRDDLLDEMERLGIQSALVRHRGALEYGPVDANRVVLEELHGVDELIPSWFLTPDGFEPDFDIAQTVNNMMSAGVKACWSDPGIEAANYCASSWCAGPLYEELQSRRIPLLLEYRILTPDQYHDILRDFPRLRLIILGAPREGRQRTLYRLLREHESLYLCLGHTYSVHRGIEDLCKTFGTDRWVFGMGYPMAEGGAAVAGLAYADIDDQAKEAIAHGNIERLLAEVTG